MKKTKQFFGLVLAIGLILTVLPVGTALANDRNLLQNGGFETSEGNAVAGWDYKSDVPGHLSSTAGTNAFVVTKDTQGAYVHSGNSALKLVSGNAEGTAGRWISQKVTGLTPGKAYRASAWVYIDGTLDSGKGLSLRLANNKGTGGSVGFAASNGSNRGYGNLLETTGGVWKNLSCTFIPSVLKNEENEVTYDATYVYVCLDFGRNAETKVNVYVNDMMLEEIVGINGSFEDTEYTVSGDTSSALWAKGWSTTNGMTGKQAFIGEHAFVAANAGQNGTNALCMTTTEDTARQLHAYVPTTGLKTGSAYRMRCYIKSSLAESAATVSLNAINTKVSGSTTYKLYESLQLAWGGSRMIAYKSATPSDAWKELSFIFTAVEPYTFIGIAATPEKGESIYIDNVTLEETNVCFTDESGNTLGETISAPGTVHAKATVIGAEGDTARVLVGVYDTEDGKTRLANVYVSDGITLPASKYADVTIENVVLSQGQYAKAIILDGMAGLKPLTEAKMLTVSAS